MPTTLDTTIPIEKYLEQIDECIQYADYDKQPYTAVQTINNAYNKVFNTRLYKELNNMCLKKISYNKNSLSSRGYLQRSIMIYADFNASTQPNQGFVGPTWP